jgi:hypothetical protein
MPDRAGEASLDKLTPFDRRFSDFSGVFSYIGSGWIGGKAQGLAFIKDSLLSRFSEKDFPDFTVRIPTMTVLATDVFDAFMKLNNLYDIAYSSERDDEQIAHAFQRSNLPPEVVGDLRALAVAIHSPLAVRSSSLFEDALREPFAGVYGTKMIPNNQFDADSRFRVLVEAVKFVYASTFFREAKTYIKTTGQSVEKEKMAVIIQEVVGMRFGDKFYPQISGVARSYNFYATGHGKPKDGVIDLALGLGKTIVDGGKSWSYCPSYPRTAPPYKSTGDMVKQTQTEFWAVNMGKPPAYDPIKESEYMVTGDLGEAETDGTLQFISSTYQPENDRLLTGIIGQGPRVITFAPILSIGDIPLNNLLKAILKTCEEVVGHEVEVEFAVTLDPENGVPARFGFLQVRPMFVSRTQVEVPLDDLDAPDALIASEKVLGNGLINTVRDAVFLKATNFNERESWLIASDLEAINHRLVAEGHPYLLIVYGRLGTTDPPFGIPVSWWQISGAKIIVEASLPDMHVEMSQGSHFFHNVISSQVGYFSVPHTGRYQIKWDWFQNQTTVTETDYVRHVKLASPLRVQIDGKSARGVIRS